MIFSNTYYSIVSSHDNRFCHPGDLHNIQEMFPKCKGATSLNSDLRGNISTYCLDAKYIDMVSDKNIPHPTKLLTSIIAVTLVNPRNITERSPPGFLCIWRTQIWAALVWLKANNPFYAHIIISDEHLDQILDDGIPDEILNLMRYPDKTENVDCEPAGYVPDDEDFEEETDIDLESTLKGVEYDVASVCVLS